MDKVWLDQIDLALRLAPYTIVTGLTVSIIVCYFFWQESTVAYVVGLQVVILGLACVGFYACASWQRGRLNSLAVPIRLIRERIVVVAALAGVALASIPVVLFNSADADGQLLIAATCAGLIATGICIGFIPAAGIVYSGCIIAGSFIALAMTGKPFFIIIAILLAIYSFFIVATIVQISRLVSLRAIVQVDLDRQREVSGLLLNDFEQNSSDWLWETDALGRIRSPSARFAEVAQSDPGDLASSLFESLVTPKSDQRSVAATYLLSAFRERRPFHRISIPVHIGRETRWWALTGKPIHDRQQRFLGFRGIGSDVTLQHEYLAKLDHLANHDLLTGLPNRRHFEKIVADARSALLDRPGGPGFAVLCLDLDRFKQVNDTFGHAVGDHLLRKIGERLEAFVGPDLVVSRFAGDEFAIIHFASDPALNAGLAERIVQSLQTPFEFDNLYLDVGVSIGIAIANDAMTSEEVLRKADAALYRMKDDGGGSYGLYTPSMDQHKEERAVLMGELRGALDRGEFALHYQPLVSADTGEPNGFEALMRWQHPLHGDVPPSEFIVLAEETGSILALGEWSLRNACHFAATWQDRTLSVAVNISTVQIRHSNLVEIVARALSDSGLEPSRLELEITETAFLATTNEAMSVIESLRRLGVRLALDDFGTGYSSLSYLKKLPVDKIKIDQSFIVDLPDVSSDVSIVKAIVELARTLGMTTTAEGVETVAQRDCLRQIGCPEFQGYLYGKPADEEATMQMIARQSRRFEPRVVA
ncbi:putative bifunctional diguanylate cyclase/phosphodiesterase [Aurantimonas endophytica]|uniref:Diguanylate cyclase (GGDEF)-like protein n=1 Tax=Aurantimonas endophytica TaxID=1522175 RepID=A0A7W6HFM4_9HYPH|nr:EAL domain-containing protein [Aurantimonas endophytica]MBB4004048.1 diguanylate cyclase (GGDEF)-like protein [Aurantimonas endophytica]MCO6404895.1 EAL domain-containing protein [Aurantimonas endophytica]